LQVETFGMDPAGVKFGLSRNLLQLDGGGIVMAADVLDAISELARRQTLTGSPEFGTDFPHLLIANGIQQVLPARDLKKDVEEELQSFCKRYADRTWCTTLLRRFEC